MSMGLGPLNAIYQARFNRYLHNRRIDDTSRVAGVVLRRRRRDATSPRRSASISLAAREQLDNLIFVVNCNLQRLDGPVRGNGKIIQELEAIFRGAGWNVIKVDLGLEVGRAAGPRRRRRARQQDEHHRRRRVPEVRGRERRLHPRALLRPRPAAAQDGRAPLRRRPAQRCPAAGTTTASSTPPTRPPPSTTGAPTVILAKTVKGWTLGPTSRPATPPTRSRR